MVHKWDGVDGLGKKSLGRAMLRAPFQANSIPKFVSSYVLCQGRGSFAGEETGGARALSQGTPRPDGLLQLQLPEIKE